MTVICWPLGPSGWAPPSRRLGIVGWGEGWRAGIEDPDVRLGVRPSPPAKCLFIVDFARFCPPKLPQSDAYSVRAVPVGLNQPPAVQLSGHWQSGSSPRGQFRVQAAVSLGTLSGSLSHCSSFGARGPCCATSAYSRVARFKPVDTKLPRACDSHGPRRAPDLPSGPRGGWVDVRAGPGRVPSARAAA